MKRVFALNVGDDVKIVGLQIAAVLQRESGSGKSVTFLTLSDDDIHENNEWLFKFNEKAERITTEEPCKDYISIQAAIDKMQELEDEDIKAYGCSIPEGFDGQRAIRALKSL